VRWLHYALGGGAGHLTRAYALARPALAAGHEVEILAGGGFSRWLIRRLRDVPGLRVTYVDPRAGKEATAATVRARVRAGGFDRFVVDCFPRGLIGELAELVVPCPRILVARAMVPAYVERPTIRAAIDSYDRLLVPGGEGPLVGHPRAHLTAPWLVRDAGELLPAPEARARLGVSDARPIVAVMGTGTHDESAALAAIAPRLATSLAARAHVRWLGPGDDGVMWPALELHAGVDTIVASAGYNTVVEARATATPLLARVQPRRYDDQGSRVRPAERWSSCEELAARLEKIERRAPGAITYVNGAAEGARLVVG
jgi:hypothetical protein